jgi:hypothetical protein
MSACDADFCCCSAWEQMGAEHFDEAPLSVPDHFELDLAGIEAGMQSNTVPSDFCVPSPSSKGSHASDFDFPWSLQNVIVKQEQFNSLPELKSSTAAPWQTSMMIPTSSLQPGGLQRAGSTAGSALASVQIKQEAMEVPCVQSPSSSSSQDVAVVPDVRRSAPCSTSPATSSSAAAVVPQSIPMVASAAHQIHRPQALPIAAPALVPAPVAVAAPPQPRPMVGLADGEFVRTRQECLERYREKKARRLYTKKIRWAKAPPAAAQYLCPPSPALGPMPGISAQPRLCCCRLRCSQPIPSFNSPASSLTCALLPRPPPQVPAAQDQR